LPEPRKIERNQQALKKSNRSNRLFSAVCVHNFGAVYRICVTLTRQKFPSATRVTFSGRVRAQFCAYLLPLMNFWARKACRDQFMMAFVGVLRMHKRRAFSAARSSTHESVYLDTVLSELRIILFDLR
jgi:hypothetical protein